MNDLWKIPKTQRMWWMQSMVFFEHQRQFPIDITIMVDVREESVFSRTIRDAIKDQIDG